MQPIRPSQTDYCLRCGQQEFRLVGNKKRQCNGCGFELYRNASAAVGAVIVCGEEILIGTRARQPCRGLLDLPGGFVDPGESLEQGLLRELQEEAGLDLPASALKYLMSGANEYLYGEVLYNTTDVFFEIQLDEKPVVTAMDDVAALQWIALGEVQLQQMAFESQKQLLRQCYGLA